MYLQTSDELNVIRRWGCYFLSLGHIAESETKKRLTAEQIIEVMALSIAHGYLKPNMFVMKPAKILDMYFNILIHPEFEAEYVGWWNLDTGQQMWSEKKPTHVVYRWNTNGAYHFRPEGFDPYPGLQLIRLSGKRFFAITSKERAE